MKFTVKQADLQNELAAAIGIVEARTTIPILSHALLTCVGGALHIAATDLELSFRGECPAQAEAEGVVTAPLKKLFDLVKLLPSDSYLGFRRLENGWTEITCQHRKYKMVGMQKENFPALPEPPKEKMQIPVAALRKVIERTLFAVSVEESRYTLNGALLVLKPKSISMVATDGHRLSLAEAPCELVGVEAVGRKILVPRRALLELKSMLNSLAEEAFVDFSQDAANLFFRAGQHLLASRMLTGRFPNYEVVLPKENNNQITLPSEELISCLRRVQQMADEKTNSVKMSLGSSGLEMKSASAEYGEAVETLSAPYIGQPLLIAFNVAYLLDFLNVVPPGPVVLKLKDGTTAGEMVMASGEPWRYVIMPLNLPAAA